MKLSASFSFSGGVRFFGSSRMMRMICLLMFFFVFSVIIPAHARTIHIETSVDGGKWQSMTAVSVLKKQKISLRVRPVDGADIRWFQIIPDISVRYHNAGWPWMPDAYQWKGFDRIKYTRKALPQFNNQWEIRLFEESRTGKKDKLTGLWRLWSYIKHIFFPPKSREGGGFHKNDLGSFWYQAEVSKGEDVFSTPGIEINDARGLSPKVLRISVRESDDLLGYLTSYFNVPPVFGSVPYQVRNYIGIDCADVLMAAYSLYKKQPVKKDFNVAMLTRKFPVIRRAVMTGGDPDSEILWGKEIQPGDFIAVRYHQGKQFQHIGALYSDANRNKRLDGEDLVLHAGPDPLHFSRFSSGVFDGEIVILRVR